MLAGWWACILCFVLFPWGPICSACTLKLETHTYYNHTKSTEMYNLCSLNVKGLNGPAKRRAVLDQLHREGHHIVFLQETHLNKTDTTRLASRRYPAQYHAPAVQKKGGTSILLAPQVNFTLKATQIDRGGRYVMIKGKLNDTTTTLASIYAPNSGQNAFLLTFLLELAGFAEGEIVLSGDWNLVPEAALDRSQATRTGQAQMSRAVTTRLKDLALTEIWRDKHPTTKDYTYYSAVHKTYSRIDLMYMSPGLKDGVHSIDIGTEILSDHCPLICTLEVKDKRVGPTPWSFNETITHDQQATHSIRESIRCYFEINDTADVSTPILWDAFKAVFRGQCIATLAQLNRKRREAIRLLSEEVASLESQHKKSPSQKIWKQLTHTRGKLKQLLTHKAEQALATLRQKFTEGGHKAGKLLALRMRKKQADRRIETLVGPGGTRVACDKDKLQLFVQYYQSLYSAEVVDKTTQQEFLAKVTLPTISPTQRQTLDRPIEAVEIIQAVKTLKLGKSPGPDGLTAKVYKTFLPELLPYLLRVFNHIRDQGSLPATMTAATITLLPKPGKDKTMCSSYRPISLLNLDIKLFTKILAGRLDKIIPEIIDPDQAGFVRGRNAFDNTRRIQALIAKVHRSGTPALLFALDAEKAFDRVNWEFLELTMKAFGLGEQMLKMILASYKTPVAAIRMNASTSTQFPIGRGTRQGCPLSPLLFALFMEPFATYVREHPKVSGIRSGLDNYTITLFADDVIFTLQDPETSLPAVQEAIGEFSAVSGFKVNMGKSELLNLTMNTEMVKALQSQSTVSWAKNKIKYLGIFLTANPEQLYAANYPHLMATIWEDMNRWRKLYTSWTGRIAMFKMNILPRMLYYFQTLACTIQKADIEGWQKKIWAFIWAGRKARIAGPKLAAPKKGGGIACPQMGKYYKAVNIRMMLEWLRVETHRSWILIAQDEIGTPLWRQPWLMKQQRPKGLYNTQATAAIIMSWDEVAGKEGFTSFPSPFTPLQQNPDFMPGMEGPNRKVWEEARCNKLGDLFEDKKIKTFTQCQWDYDLGETERYHYTQLKHWALQTQNKQAALRPLTRFEKLTQTDMLGKGMISTIYNMQITIPTEALRTLQDKWAQDLGAPLTEQQWECIWANIDHTSRNTSHRESMLKIAHRAYWTPKLAHKIKATNSPLCWRKCGGGGDYWHMWWSCPVIQVFWTKVVGEVKGMLGDKSQYPPERILLNCCPPTEKFLKGKHSALENRLFLAAKLCVAQSWKKDEAPDIHQWRTKCWDILAMDKIHFRQNGNCKKFQYIWEPYLVYVKKECILMGCPRYLIQTSFDII